MNHDEAVEFCVALCVVVHQHDQLETVLDEPFDDNDRNSIINHFEFLDNEQLTMLEDEDIQEDLENNIAILRTDFIELISDEIIRKSSEQSIEITERQLELAIIIHETGEMPYWFWTDFSKDTALDLGFFPRINSNGFYYIQIISIGHNEEENLFHALMRNVNNLIALKWLKSNGTICLK